MPKQHPPARKIEALELLALYDKVSTVQRLTGIPSSTLHRWRAEESQKNPRLSAKKDFPLAEKNAQTTHMSPIPAESTAMDAQSTQNAPKTTARLPDEYTSPQTETEIDAAAPEQHLDSDDEYFWAKKKTPAGVPGKTYPYPLEEDEDPNSRFEEFRELRDMLLRHARELAADLKPTDPDINLRSLALARILDRVRQLDDLLPDLNPERVMRFEYVYDGMVHNVPPWEGVIEHQDEFREEMRRKISEAGVI